MDNEAVFGDLKEAYDVLTTPDRREPYDQAAWGETFVPGGMDATLMPGGMDATLMPSAPALSIAPNMVRCPMGADAACPAVLGRTGPDDVYCPECGFGLAGLTAGGSGAGDAPGPSREIRLEETGGRSHFLRPGTNIVGREGTDVLLLDKTVSRRHAQVEVDGDGAVTVEDMGSTNGTQVGGETLVPHVPRRAYAGDRVRFGSVLLSLHLPDPSVSHSSPPSPPPFPLGEEGRGEAPTGEILGQVVELREDDPRVYPLPPGRTTFGRRADNTVVLSGDPYVSGSHAQIVVDGAAFTLTDTGSTNGTLLNGERLAINAPVLLTPGDVVLIGGTALRFERLGLADEEPVSEAPEPEVPEPEMQKPEVPEPEAPEDKPTP